MVDKNLILRKIAELEEYLGQIKELPDITVEDYAREWKTQRIVERTLQIMIELCVDIANHVIADQNLRVPVSYADTFKVLREAELIDQDLLNTMDRMAKFRNIVVHNYDRIDQAIVVTILRKHLDSFLLFRNAILGILKCRERWNGRYDNLHDIGSAYTKSKKLRKALLRCLEYAWFPWMASWKN